MKSNTHVPGLAVVVPRAAGLSHFGFSGGMFAAARGATAFSFQWVESLVAVPVWALGLIWAAILTALGAALLFAFNRRRSIVLETPALTKAEVFGLRWRWSYDAGVITELASYCPECDREVSAKTENRHGFLHLISYQCVCRRWRSKSFQCSQAEMLDRVTQAIAQKSAKSPTCQRPQPATG